jgi:hypothetical protein
MSRLSSDSSWSVNNHQYLTAYVAYLLAIVEERSGNRGEGSPLPPRPEWKDFKDSVDNPPPALARLAALFDLSRFEQEILVLCVAVEMERSLSALCSVLNGNQQQAFLTFRVAIAVLAEPNWHALMPTAALRHWHLVDLAVGTELTQASLRIDERILHELLGRPYVDARLKGVLSYVPLGDRSIVAADSHQAVAAKIADIVQTQGQPYLQLCGQDLATLQQIVMVACRQLGRPLFVISVEALPTDRVQSNLVQRLCEREALLSQGVLLFVCDRLSTEGTQGTQQAAALARFIDHCQVPVILMQQEHRTWGSRSALTIDVEPLRPVEQAQIWRMALERSQVATATGTIDRLVSTFNLNAQMIQSVVSQTANISANDADSLWQNCLEQARPRFDGLAQQIQSQLGWEDLVLPEKEIAVLQTISAHVRQRSKVYEQWGFGAKSRRGLGISALFAGASGTGKTLAAEVLANELHLDLHRIDISSVVSKYIGETEKNLRKIFDAAESGGAILLFDEADALFGKRSDVKDSHDRYANMEVAYLLQRIEAYRGLAILTTNLKDSIDQAFLRRIRFVVQFPFPDVAQRAEIWRRVFPAQTPMQKLSHHKLAKLSVAGGNIRNIALNAAFLAADAEESVGMGHILQAAQAEYMKLERPLTDQEVRGWTNSGESA